MDLRRFLNIHLAVVVLLLQNVNPRAEVPASFARLHLSPRPPFALFTPLFHGRNQFDYGLQPTC